MKLKIGERYKLSSKLKSAFGIDEVDAKVISISNGIITLQVGPEVFPLKESIAIAELSSSYELSARFTQEKMEQREKIAQDIPEEVNDDRPGIATTPQLEEPVQDDTYVVDPEKESDSEVVVQEEPLQTEPKEDNSTEPEAVEEDGISASPLDPQHEPEPEEVMDNEGGMIYNKEPDSELNIDNNITITEPKPEVIEEEPQDNPEPEPTDPWVDDNYNPDDEWGF